MLLIVDNMLLDDDEIKRICQTKEGAKKINAVRLSTRTAFASEHMLGYIKHELKAFNRELTYEERENLCNILFYCLFNAQQSEVDKYVKDCYNHIEEHQFQMPLAVGNA